MQHVCFWNSEVSLYHRIGGSEADEIDPEPDRSIWY